MSVAALSRRGVASSDSEFTCPHYAPMPGSKRCQSYQDGGTCSRPDFFLCTEWEKRNRHRLPTRADVGAEQSPSVEPAAPVPTDLFGNPAPELAPPKETPKPAPSSAAATIPTKPADDHAVTRPLRGLTTEDIESFKALGVAVCMRSEACGEVWLVPAYTGLDRKEITPEHAATICRVVEAFPGSRVVAFEKNPKPDKEPRA